MAEDGYAYLRTLIAEPNYQELNPIEAYQIKELLEERDHLSAVLHAIEEFVQKKLAQRNNAD